MTVKVVSYPGCCTAKILIGFGQENNAGWDARVERIVTLEKMKEDVDKAIRGHLIGRHNGVVSACLTSRQTRGIQALTELGFHASPSFYKTGHRESRLQTFYINPDEFIQNNPVPYQAPVVPRPAGAKRLVKDLNAHSTYWYKLYQRRARDAEFRATQTRIPERVQYWVDYARDQRTRAKALLEVDANFS